MLDFPVILASASPRRFQLLQNVGLRPIVKVASVDEQIFCHELPQEYAKRLAVAKGKAIVDLHGDDCIVIGADTIVVLDNDVLGKPRDILEAANFLRRLSGRWHLVMTAISLHWKNRLLTRHETTRVEFTHLSDDMIRAYLETGDFADKAGGYGIQSIGALFIPRIDGCFFNVMGFPIHLFFKMVEEIGLTNVHKAHQ